jgi:hypothetical protein
MTDEAQVTKLRSVPQTGGTADRANRLDELYKFVTSNELLTEWDADDVTLETNGPDEREVGRLNFHEKSLYVLGQLLQQVLANTMIDVEADGADEIASIMRDKRLNMAQAAAHYRENTEEFLSVETRVFMNQCALTVGRCLAEYELSVRLRHGVWLTPLIVRNDFVAYTYG